MSVSSQSIAPAGLFRLGSGFGLLHADEEKCEQAIEGQAQCELREDFFQKNISFTAYGGNAGQEVAMVYFSHNYVYSVSFKGSPMATRRFQMK